MVIMVKMKAIALLVDSISGCICGVHVDLKSSEKTISTIMVHKG